MLPLGDRWKSEEVDPGNSLKVYFGKGKMTTVILHIDDSAEDAELVSALFDDYGDQYKINYVPDGSSYIEFLEKTRPDIILSDFHIPGFDGFEALAIAKKKYPHTPFIFVTGAVGEEMAISALKSGADDFILKRNLIRLIPSVNRALDHYEKEAHRRSLYQELCHSEERYRTLMDNLSIGVFRTSITGPAKVLQANLSAAHIHGFETIDQMKQFPVDDLYFNPEDRAVFLSDVITRGKVKNRVIQFKKINGETFWGSVSASCHFDKSGKPEWIDGVLEDITEKVEIENRLQGNLQFLETLLDTINSPVFYKDTGGIYLGCNRSFAEMIIGLPREKIINKTVYELHEVIPNELALKYDEKDRALFDNPGIQEYESRVRCADGIFRYFHFSKSTYPGTGTQVAGLVGIMVDITERVGSERELRRINEELDLLINSLSSIIIGVSIKDRITHWNPFAAEVFGLTAEEIYGKRFFESGIKWDWSIIYEAISESILEEKSIRIDDLKFENIQGKSGIMGLTINPLKRGGEILDGFIILGKDLTEQKFLEAQLLQSNKLEAIGQLAAGVAHEINTPMQYIGDNLKFIKKSFTGLIRVLEVYKNPLTDNCDSVEINSRISRIKDVSEDINLPYLIEQMPMALDQSLEGVARVSGIVHSMKSFSHPGAGQKMPADINRAIENTVTVSSNEWKYDCEMQLNLNPDLPAVPCFESEFNQVILNLIVNARDAVREAKESKKIESGLITITTERSGAHIVVKVKDNGAGIPAEIMPKIFDPFFTTKDVGKGTGQGLPISHSIIVEKHEGSLYFESENGNGTVFIIKLPLEDKWDSTRTG